MGHSTGVVYIYIYSQSFFLMGLFALLLVINKKIITIIINSCRPIVVSSCNCMQVAFQILDEGLSFGAQTKC